MMAMLERIGVSTINTSETTTHFHFPSNMSTWCVKDDDIAGTAAAAAAAAIATTAVTAASPTSVTAPWTTRGLR